MKPKPILDMTKSYLDFPPYFDGIAPMSIQRNWFALLILYTGLVGSNWKIVNVFFRQKTWIDF